MKETDTAPVLALNNTYSALEGSAKEPGSPTWPAKGGDAEEATWDLLCRLDRDRSVTERNLENMSRQLDHTADELAKAQQESGAKVAASLSLNGAAATAAEALMECHEAALAGGASEEKTAGSPGREISGLRQRAAQLESEKHTLRRKLDEFEELRVRAERRAKEMEEQKRVIQESVAVYGEKVKAKKAELRCQIELLQHKVTELEASNERLAAENARLLECTADVRGTGNTVECQTDPFPDTSTPRSNILGMTCCKSSDEWSSGSSQGSAPRERGLKALPSPPRDGFLSVLYTATDPFDNETEVRMVLRIEDTHSPSCILHIACDQLSARFGVPLDPALMCIRVSAKDFKRDPPGILSERPAPATSFLPRRPHIYTTHHEKELRQYDFFHHWIRDQPDPFWIAVTLTRLRDRTNSSFRVKSSPVRATPSRRRPPTVPSFRVTPPRREGTPPSLRWPSPLSREPLSLGRTSSPLVGGSRWRYPTVDDPRGIRDSPGHGLL